MTGNRSRVTSVDIVRGGVMVLMALDHVRDFVTNLRFQPENLARGSALLFATRWVTHFCAPAFALLAGLGIGLSMNRGKPAGEMSRFLITRGLWLIFLEFVVMSIGWQFKIQLLPAFALVLWVLGLSMIVMAALIHLPATLVGAAAVATIAGHNLLDGIPPASWGAFAWLWHVLHVPGFAIPGKLLVGYPLVPWVAVMALGWALADLYRWDAKRRQRALILAGVAATLLFIAVRALNAYGDPAPWMAQRTPALTAASFLNVRKYPPSLDFLLMTLGPALIALAIAERARGSLARWLSVYGRVPLFYFVVHIYMVHALAIALVWVQGGAPQRVLVVTDPSSVPPWFGVSLPGVYLAWALVVLAMYPLCLWFGRLKARRTDWWLGYL